MKACDSGSIASLSNAAIGAKELAKKHELWPREVYVTEVVMLREKNTRKVRPLVRDRILVLCKWRLRDAG